MTIPDTHILVVDDDDRLRALLKQYLTEHGFFVSTADAPAQAEEILRQFVVDLMVLDVMMPKETGVHFAKRLREQSVTSKLREPRSEGGPPPSDLQCPPILLLTARAEAEDRIAGLEAGAEDYLAKPFAPRELVLRLENILHRNKVLTPREPQMHVVFGDYRFALDTGRLDGPDGPIYLTGSEVECLRILARKAGQPVSREAIAEAAGDVQNERSVDVQINRLRKKIEPQPGKPIYIQTVRHAGYVLHAQGEA